MHASNLQQVAEDEHGAGEKKKHNVFIHTRARISFV